MRSSYHTRIREFSIVVHTPKGQVNLKAFCAGSNLRKEIVKNCPDFTVAYYWLVGQESRGKGTVFA